MTRPALAYLRVSSKPQADEGASLPEQERRVRDYAARHDLELVRVVVAAESAKAPGRKAFAALVAELKLPRAPSVLLFEDADRATRNPWDALALEELRLAGLEIHLTRSGIVLARDTDPGVLMAWRTQLTFAQFYVEKLSREVKKGQGGALADGRWPHRAPFGMVSIREPGRRRRLAPDPEKAPALVAAAEAVIAGASLARAAHVIFDMGVRSPRGRRLQPQEIGAILRHPVIGGYIPRGTWRQAKHARGGPLTLEPTDAIDPAIPRATWDELQRVLDGRASGRSRRTKGHADAFSFSGLIRCADCGAAVACEFRQGKTGRGAYVYYRCGQRCQGGGRYVREERLVAQVVEQLERLRFPAWILDALRDHLRADHDEGGRASVAKADALRAQDARLAARLDRAYLDCLDGRLAPDRHDALAAEWRREREEIAASLERLRTDDAEWIDRSLALMALARDSAGTYQRATPEERREQAGLLFRAPLRLAGDRLMAELHPAFALLADAAAREIPTPAMSLTGQDLGDARDHSAVAGGMSGPNPRNLSPAHALREHAAQATPLGGERVTHPQPALTAWVAVAIALRAA